MQPIRQVANDLDVTLPIHAEGRHAAHHHAGRNPVEALSVGAICHVLGYPRPVATGAHAYGRHAEDEPTVVIAIAA